jgi:transcriptional regulator with XRE-family HTH domain
VGWRVSVATIERQRILHGFTRDALARAARIDPKTVRDALNERRRPTLGTIDRIARTLDLTLADVVVIEDSPSIADRFRPKPTATVQSPIRAVEQLRFLN